MDWEKKAEIIHLANKMNRNGGSRSDFQDFCLAQMPNFDNQAWCMFFDCVNIIQSEMIEDYSFWSNAWKYIKEINVNDRGLRFSFRASLVQIICKEKLMLN